MSKFPERLRLKERADEDRFFARSDRALLEQLRQRRSAGAQALVVVSGGQTGVDRAALDMALAAGIAVGGWCPSGRRAEDGVVPARYPLRETPSLEYAERSDWNVRDSDATVILYRRALAGGSRLTLDLATRQNKPVICRDLSGNLDIASIVHWLKLNRVRIINCAGPRETDAPGVYRQASSVFADLFAKWKLIEW